jgi:iron complex outermembrane receptor protein
VVYFIRSYRQAALISLFVTFALSQSVASHAAQAGQAAGVTVSGTLTHSVTTKPVAKATVMIEGTRLITTSDADGRFAIENVPPGTYHLIVAAPGFATARKDIVVQQTPVTADVAVDPQLHYMEVVSVSPDARSAFESYQPTSVLAGQDLAKELEGSLGATLAKQPGVAERSLGPGPSRPVIRGLDGDRVLILQDGQRLGDLSSQSGDHGVTVNPASAARIEVVRGPATLLYGANAIGGLVNVISDTIPTQQITGVRGGATFDVATANTGVGAAADVLWGNSRWALHASGDGRRSGDVDTPEGSVDNTQSRGGSGSLGVAWTAEKGYFGGSFGYDDTKYGIPFLEEGQIQLTPRRHIVNVRGGGRGFAGPVESFRSSLAVRRYRHEELVGSEVGTKFENDTVEGDLLARHRTAGRLSGTIGGWFLTRDFNAIGEEALSPPVKENGVAAFLYEEVTWPHATFQFGARVDHARFRPAEGLRSRDFTDVSGSIGLLLRPAAANERVTVAFSLARAARHPALEELYFFGLHPGNFSFEIGNDGLGSEKAIGFDASLRWRHRRASGEITFFRNHINDYIFRNPISAEAFAEQFPSEELEEEEFPFIQFIAADSVLQGIEAHTDFELATGVLAELGIDYVRGELSDGNQPLPRIPPLRFRGGLRYQRNAFQGGFEVTATTKQDRIFGEETPTDGYSLLKLFAAWSFQSGQAVNTFSARLDNATNELYSNHLSLIKDFVPEMGRNFKLVYSVRF